MSSGRNGKKIPDLPARAKMLKFLYMDGELPETDSIINMFCGQSSTLQAIARRKLVRLFRSVLNEVNMDLHGSMEYTFAENIEHFDSVHQTATLVADMKLREQRAVSSPQLQSSMNSPTMSDFHNESFQSSQTSESLRSRATASSSSAPRRYLANTNTNLSRLASSSSLIPRPATTHMMVFQTTRYARIGLNLEVANAIVLKYAEYAENILLRQEIAILVAEQIDRKARVKQAEKDAKAREKREAKIAKMARRGQRNASSVNVANADDPMSRADMYSNMFATAPVAKTRTTTDGGSHQMYGNLFLTKDM